MLQLRTYLVAFVAWLLIAASGVSIAHTAEHGHGPHDHDGIACDIAVLEDEADLALPPPEAPSLHTELREAAPQSVAFTSIDWLAAPARAPPGRAPPL